MGQKAGFYRSQDGKGVYVPRNIVHIMSLHGRKVMSVRVPCKNQRTNGPVNAHLISGPTVSTKNIPPIGHCRKIGQGQLSVIIYILNKK